MNIGLLDALTLVAIVVGPIAAVLITRMLDNRNAAYARRYQVFRDLVRTRSAKISPEHVNALNLVEIEFNQFPEVKTSWDRYMEALSMKIGGGDEAFNQYVVRRDQLFIKLVQNIANVLGMKHVDITDVMTTNYYPQGWQNDEEEQRRLRALLIPVFSGSHPIPVRLHDTTKWNGPYPPMIQPTVQEASKPNGSGQPGVT
jgi:hypothetical protein